MATPDTPTPGCQARRATDGEADQRVRDVMPGSAQHVAVPPVIGDFEALLARARRLAGVGSRRLLGMAGSPGAGKSTLAGAIVEALGDTARLVPMDGFHLANAELVRLGRRERKGAIDTFDAAGYVALLRRLRDPAEQLVYAPEFRREIEEPIAGAVAVPRDVPLVVTEGNYLLATDGHWGEVRALLDEAWYIDLSEETRLARLTQRHLDYGMSWEAARAMSVGSDQRNAELVAATRQHADVLVRLDALRFPQHLDHNQR
jgi:pantothenate kinase